MLFRSPPDGIAAARAAADGATNLAINGVTVTYVKPALGSDLAGFTIQHAQTGPALLVEVDPTTLTPAPNVGDVVNFTITQMGTVANQRRAQTIGSYTRQSTGASIAALTQDVSATDLVTSAGSYDAEIVTASGAIAAVFAASGTGFQSATFSTAGSSGNALLKLRAPASMVDSADLVNGCQLTATRVPFAAVNSMAVIGAYRPADVAVTSCPAPTVVSATSLSATSVQVTFSRHVLPTSLQANGSQFTFDHGLVASAASLSGRTVTVTTSAQTPSTSYGVTVAHSVTDLQGTALTTPDAATFSGFVVPAVVRINEFNANITGGCDLIELRVVSSGSLAGFRILERTGIVANGEMNYAFPTMNVATNDIIVVHTNSSSATCNSGGATQETASITEQPAASFPGNFDVAFDLWSSDAGLNATDNVLTVVDSLGTIIDAVFASDDPAGISTAADTKQQAGVVGTANQWSPAFTTYDDTTFRKNAVEDLNATSATASGNSIQRVDNSDDNNKADWTTGAGTLATFGLLNVGQTAFPTPRATAPTPVRSRVPIRSSPGRGQPPAPARRLRRARSPA